MDDSVTPVPKIPARTEFRRLRRLLPGTAAQEAGLALADHALAELPELVPAGGTVAAYLSAGSEPATASLLEGLVEAGYDVVLPVCEPGRRLSWCHWTPGTALQPGLFPSVPEPVGKRLSLQELPALDLVFLPALAIDSAGVRMGQGGGYYDRFLAELRAAGNNALAVALVYDHEFVPAGSWASDAFDQPVDGVLTPSGWTWLPLDPAGSRHAV
ncbi:5-formyltetrahydrofolate cyclo-ligase [Arthrobacter jiangjiafuii]|uniref:5-formyltetrahydrofolate cyclo-ligase n=1 Tax=Arthrobacter jiangjiafuii TaxID=2817475 RepID=A0A975M434_9MICC|nr:5-formyltetrahydrofolate cyclo-ligase [Arthrobacter jiangjiafuii]MBP3042874.1 5-formyltetrahydrofolate cyclo-ligase [Arthrobacter jiangjiafuii]QWC09419.1 5-formyltetrahydrofolate cyclo-ligase [Arthrobacter jiangjiafuii]